MRVTCFLLTCTVLVTGGQTVAAARTADLSVTSELQLARVRNESAEHVNALLQSRLTFLENLLGTGQDVDLVAAFRISSSCGPSLRAWVLAIGANTSLFEQRVDTAGVIYSAVGFGSGSAVKRKTPTRPHHSSSRAAMHAANRYMWVSTIEGVSFDVALSTVHFAHRVHGGTRVGVEAPISGFLHRGKLYIDPKGTICEPLNSSTLSPAPADAAFSAEYATMGLLPGSRTPEGARGASDVCVVMGHVLVGVTSTAAEKLSDFLLREAAVTIDDVSRNAKPRPGHLRHADTGQTSDDSSSSSSSSSDSTTSDFADPAVMARQLGKTSVAQSAGIRTMLVLRFVWADQDASNAMSDASYLAYASAFVAYANARSYGNMIIVPTYTPGCVYNLRHTSMDAALPVNSDSLGGWIFGEADYAVQNSYPTCIQSMASFNHVFMIVGALSAPWAGLGFQPGSRFVIQGGYGSATSFHEFGHNLGLMHSNRWDPYTLTNIEYGDDMSVMGLGDWVSVPGVDFPAGYKHAINWLPDDFVVDATVSSVASTAFSLGSQTIVGTPTLPLTLRAVSSWGVSDHFLYGTFAPNVAGASNALFLHTVALGWTDLHSYAGSGSNSFSNGVIGNSFMVDVAPGTYTLQDAPLFPGDAYVYGPWYSPASGQAPAAPGVSNGVANTTSLLLIENLAAQSSVSLRLRSALISAATGERPEGLGCDADGCVASATPIQLVCGSNASTVAVTRLNPTALWRVLPPLSAAGTPQMATLSTCGSSGATELGAYRSIPYAQFFYGASITSGAFASATLQVDYLGVSAAQSCGTILVPLSSTEPLYIAARFTNRAPGNVTLTTSCATSVAPDWSLLNVTINGDASASGIYERSAAEPQRNGFPHWIKQNEGATLGVSIYHLYFASQTWVVSSAPRGGTEHTSYRSNHAVYAPPTTLSTFSSGVAVAAVRFCPSGSYMQNFGNSTNSTLCFACGAYEFASPGSSSASDCACAPGAGLYGGTCAPCTGDSFRASVAANAPCNPCPAGTFALDGAQAPAGCHMPTCDQITVQGTGSPSFDGVYNLTSTIVGGRPTWKGTTWIISAYGRNAWIWSHYIGECCYYRIVNEAAPPWGWTGSVTAQCTCSPGSTLSTDRSSNWGSCKTPAAALSSNESCPEGFVLNVTQSSCAACPGYSIADDTGTSCMCPVGYSGDSCSDPPSVVIVVASGDVDAALGGAYVLNSSGLTSFGAPYPIYAKASPYWSFTEPNGVDVLLSYLPSSRSWALSSATAGPGVRKFAYTNNETMASIAVPINAPAIPALAFNAADALMFSLRGYLSFQYSLTPSQSMSPSATATQSQTTSATISSTASQSQSVSATASQSVSTTPSGSTSVSSSASQTQSKSVTASQTRSTSGSATLTRSTAQTVTQSRSGSQSRSETRTSTLTRSQTRSTTRTSVATTSQLNTPTASQTSSASSSESGSSSPTQSPSHSASGSASASKSQTASLTASPTGTPSTTFTRSSTKTGSPTSSETRTQTQTRSITRTNTQTQRPSTSQSASTTISRRVTPTSTATQAGTSSVSASMTMTNSPSLSQSVTLTQMQTIPSSMTPTHTATHSQTSSGFPIAVAFDDTDFPYGSGNLAAVREVNASIWRGVLMYWPERDPGCGPGRYRLYLMALQLTQAPSSDNIVMLNISLFTSDNVTRQLGTLIASTTVVNSVTSVCSYSSLPPFPPDFVVDTLVSRFYIIIISSNVAVDWCDVISGVPPVTGFAEPLEPVASYDSGRTLVQDVSFAGLYLSARKTHCSLSPSSTSSQSLSHTAAASGSPSQSSSQSVSMSATPSMTRSTSGTLSEPLVTVSGTGSASTSASATRSTSATGSQSTSTGFTYTATSSPSMSASNQASSSSSGSQSQSGTSRASASSTPTTTQTASGSELEAISASGSDSQSVTSSESLTSTRSPSMSSSVSSSSTTSASCTATLRTASTTPSSSQSASQSSSASHTQTESASTTGTTTPSCSASPTQTVTETLTPSLSSSNSRSPSQTLSQVRTPSQSPSGLPPGIVVDNTNTLYSGIDMASPPRNISSGERRGIVLHWPESDPNCGPGQYTLLQLQLPLTLTPPGLVTITVSLSTWSNVSFAPIVTVASVALTVAILPTQATFIALPLPFSMFINAVTTKFYVLTWQSNIGGLQWYSMVGADQLLPGFAEAHAAVVSSDGGQTFQDDATYGGIYLVGQKLACSPTTTQSQTPSSTQSQIATLSLSTTQTASQTATESLSLTQSTSQAATPSGSASQALSQSMTATLTQSESLTQTQSSSALRTPTQSPTGFPAGIVIDNTNLGYLDLDASPLHNISTDQRRGVLLYWPENDPTCGPGKYIISRVFLSISVKISAPVTFNISLFFAANGSSSLGARIVTTALTSHAVQTFPSTTDLGELPVSFVVDTLISRFYMLTWSSDVPVQQYATLNGLDTPVTGFAQPISPVVSVDGGASYEFGSAYGGIYVYGRKTACSPSCSQTQSSSRSTSVTSSQSATMSPSTSQTQSVSGTRSRSQSASATLTPSSSGSTTPSSSASPSMSETPSVSSSQSGTRSMSETGTQISTPTASMSMSETPTARASSSSTPSVTPSLTPSRSSTRTSTQARTPSKSMRPSSSYSWSLTSSLSQSSSQSSTASSSSSASVTASPSNSPSLTTSPSISSSLTTSVSSTSTVTSTSSKSPSVTLSSSSSSTPTSTRSSSVTPTSTSTPTQVPTRSSSSSLTHSQVMTSSPSGTSTPSLTASSSRTASQRPSLSSTASSSASATRSASQTASQSQSIGPCLFGSETGRAYGRNLILQPCMVASGEPWASAPSGGFTQEILNGGTVCLDLCGGRLTVGTHVGTWWCKRPLAPNQIWNQEWSSPVPHGFSTGVSSAWCLAAQSPGGLGAPATIAPCNASDPLQSVIYNVTMGRLILGDFCFDSQISATMTPSMSSTSTMSPSSTPSVSPSSAPTPSQTLTETSSASATGSQSPTASQTPTSTLSGSGTPTLTRSPTASPSQSRTQTSTASTTSTLTKSSTGTISSTTTGSSTQSQSKSSTGSLTQSVTPSLTATCSATSSQALTRALSSSQSVSFSPSQSASTSGTTSTTVTSSSTQSVSPTESRTPTSSPSQSASVSQSGTTSMLQTLSTSSTETLSVSMTPSLTPSQTLTSSSTGTASLSLTGSASQSLTLITSQSPSSSLTSTQAGSPTQSVSSLGTNSQTVTLSRTLSPSSTLTVTQSSSPTQSTTLTSTETTSQTATASSTRIPSLSSTPSGTRTSSITQSGSLTTSATTSQTRSASVSKTGTSTLTMTQSRSRTRTASYTGSASQSTTSSTTRSPSASRSSSQTGSSSSSSSQSVSASQMASISSSTSQSMTSSTTQSQTRSLTVTLSSSRSQSASRTQSRSPSVTRSGSRTLSRTVSPSLTNSLGAALLNATLNVSSGCLVSVFNGSGNISVPCDAVSDRTATGVGDLSATVVGAGVAASALLLLLLVLVLLLLLRRHAKRTRTKPDPATKLRDTAAESLASPELIPEPLVWTTPAEASPPSVVASDEVASSLTCVRVHDACDATNAPASADSSSTDTGSNSELSLVNPPMDMPDPSPPLFSPRPRITSLDAAPGPAPTDPGPSIETTMMEEARARAAYAAASRTFQQRMAAPRIPVSDLATSIEAKEPAPDVAGAGIRLAAGREPLPSARIVAPQKKRVLPKLASFRRAGVGLDAPVPHYATPLTARATPKVPEPEPLPLAVTLRSGGVDTLSAHTASLFAPSGALRSASDPPAVVPSIPLAPETSALDTFIASRAAPAAQASPRRRAPEPSPRAAVEATGSPPPVQVVTDQKAPAMTSARVWRPTGVAAVGSEVSLRMPGWESRSRKLVNSLLGGAKHAVVDSRVETAQGGVVSVVKSHPALALVSEGHAPSINATPAGALSAPYRPDASEGVDDSRTIPVTLPGAVSTALLGVDAPGSQINAATMPQWKPRPRALPSVGRGRGRGFVAVGSLAPGSTASVTVLPRTDSSSLLAAAAAAMKP